MAYISLNNKHYRFTKESINEMETLNKITHDYPEEEQTVNLYCNDTKQLINTKKNKGDKFCGIYHSHPINEFAILSPTDISGLDDLFKQIKILCLGTPEANINEKLLCYKLKSEAESKIRKEARNKELDILANELDNISKLVNKGLIKNNIELKKHPVVKKMLSFIKKDLQLYNPKDFIEE